MLAFLLATALAEEPDWSSPTLGDLAGVSRAAVLATVTSVELDDVWMRCTGGAIQTVELEVAETLYGTARDRWTVALRVEAPVSDSGFRVPCLPEEDPTGMCLVVCEQPAAHRPVSAGQSGIFFVSKGSVWTRDGYVPTVVGSIGGIIWSDTMLHALEYPRASVLTRGEGRNTRLIPMKCEETGGCPRKTLLTSDDPAEEFQRVLGAIRDGLR